MNNPPPPPQETENPPPPQKKSFISNISSDLFNPKQRDPKNRGLTYLRMEREPTGLYSPYHEANELETWYYYKDKDGNEVKFKEMLVSGGRKSRRNRKSKKTRKGKSRKNRKRSNRRR